MKLTLIIYIICISICLSLFSLSLSLCSYYIRSGIHYGADYSVYGRDPSQCHSEMCVLVISDGSIDASVDHEVRTEAIGTDAAPPLPTPTPMTWRSLSALTRVIPDVMKLLVLCYVVRGHAIVISQTEIPITIESSQQQQTPRAQAQTVLDKDVCQYSIEYLDQWVVRPVTVISRRPNHRSEEFATIGNIQRKYQQQTKPAVATKKKYQSQGNKRKRFVLLCYFDYK